ncbi:MAG: DUF1015 family protein [Verrucomicrobiota bacterium]
MRIKAFQAWRPAPQLAAKVASLPYDVVNTAEARELSKGNANSFFHVSRAEIDLPAGTDLHAEQVYQKAAENFRRLLSDGVLVREDKPSLYVYRLVRGTHEQRGIVAVCHVGDYERNVIKKHEKTRKAPEDDRTKHIDATNAHSGPVFLAYRDQAEINRIAARTEQGAPLYDFTAADGIRHTVWRLSDAGAVVEAFARVPEAYIADGHHRAAAAVRVALRRAAGGKAAGDEEYNWFLAVLFPAGQLCILPYNRCVHDLNGLSQEKFLEAVRQHFRVTEGADPEPAKPGHISMYLAGKWYGLYWAPDAAPDPVSSLDVSVLQDRLLSPVLAIDDPRSSPRIEFVGGIRGTAELVKKVDSGKAAVAFSMYPTTVEQLMRISDAGQTMPPKSTWFEPKLRDGLLIHTLD